MPVRPLTPDEIPAPKPQVEAPVALPTLTVFGLDPAGQASPSITSALNAVRHRIRDGVASQDTVPVTFNMVRLENLSDQIVAAETVYQCRYQNIPTQGYMNASVVAGTLVAYVDNTWTPIHPTVDVDVNGNFTLLVAPTTSLLITYAWQYLSDGEMIQFLDEARQWLREFPTVATIPDGLVPALVSYASSRALGALSRSATLAPVVAGDSSVDWSKLGDAYLKQATASYATACEERKLFYTQGPEALDPNAGSVGAPAEEPYTPLR